MPGENYPSATVIPRRALVIRTMGAMKLARNTTNKVKLRHYTFHFGLCQISTSIKTAPMDVYPHRMTAAHARKARKIGKGNESKGVRMAVERFDFGAQDTKRDDANGAVPRRRKTDKSP